MSSIKDAYNLHAEAYHQKRLDPSRGFWNRWIEYPAMERLLQPLASGRRIADLGCGTGDLTAIISSWGGTASGIDVSEAMINIAKSNHPGIDFRVGDICSTNFV